MVDLVALGLTSTSQEQVEMSLHLLCSSMGLDNARPDVMYVIYMSACAGVI